MFQAALLALALLAPPDPASGDARSTGVRSTGDARIETFARSRPLDAPTTAGVHSAPAIDLPSDKAAHVLGGFWSAGAGYAYGTHRGWDPADRRAAGLAAAVAASLAKEAFDAWIQDESFSAGDLLADGVGAAVFLGIALVAGP